MSSPKRRTITKSGSSGKSPQKATSSPAKSSSATAPASFEQVFGKGEDDPQVKWLRSQISRAQERMEQLEKQPVPTLAIFRQRHQQRLWKARKLVKDCNEALAQLTGK